jgi:hypothetical protein
MYTSAQDKVRRQAKTEHIFHATLTALESLRSGQKRSKKKALPKIVETYIPTKMLYEAMAMNLLLWTVTLG